MKVKFIKQVDHIEAGTEREFKEPLAKELIKGGFAIEVKEEKQPVKTKELKVSRKTK